MGAPPTEAYRVTVSSSWLFVAMSYIVAGPSVLLRTARSYVIAALGAAESYITGSVDFDAISYTVSEAPGFVVSGAAESYLTGSVLCFDAMSYIAAGPVS